MLGLLEIVNGKLPAVQKVVASRFLFFSLPQPANQAAAESRQDESTQSGGADIHHWTLSVWTLNRNPAEPRDWASIEVWQ